MRELDIQRRIVHAAPVGLSSEVAVEVKRQYRGDDVPVAASLLTDLITERVQRAVLLLANGDIDRLRRFAERARRDFRDVIFWAETPRAEDEARTWAEFAARVGMPSADMP